MMLVVRIAGPMPGCVGGWQWRRPRPRHPAPPPAPLPSNQPSPTKSWAAPPAPQAPRPAPRAAWGRRLHGRCRSLWAQACRVSTQRRWSGTTGKLALQCFGAARCPTARPAPRPPVGRGSGRPRWVPAAHQDRGLGARSPGPRGCWACPPRAWGSRRLRCRPRRLGRCSGPAARPQPSRLRRRCSPPPSGSARVDPDSRRPLLREASATANMKANRRCDSCA
mmetsp:Transcript_172122/g.546370  ORF Transcript_172122/g.546370 Transcript_172122/m.546370 type:complete len:222 (+) Transcript_172122:2-667(+)